MRDSTIFYRSFYEAIKELPFENQAEIYTAIFEYSLNFNDIELTGLSKSIFTLIKPQIDANIKRYKNGSIPKISKVEAKPKRNISKVEANANVNLNNNKNVNLNEKDMEKPKGIFPEDLEKVFNQFLEMRKKTKKPPTERAIELLRIKLRKLADNKQKKAIEILNQSIINNWQDLYQLKTTQQNGQPINKSNRELSEEIDLRIIAKLTGENVDSEHIPSRNLLE